MASWSFFENPVFWLVVLPVVVLVLCVASLYRRESKLKAFAAKHQLRLGPRTIMSPDPGIRRVSLGAEYPTFMEGSMEGVPVVAFDFMIGPEQNATRGSGVGVKRRLGDLEGLARTSRLPVVAAQHGEWTYLYSRRSNLRPLGWLSFKDLERLWRVLLDASASEAAATTGRLTVVEASVHIPPRRRATTRPS